MALVVMRVLVHVVDVADLVDLGFWFIRYLRNSISWLQ